MHALTKAPSLSSLSEVRDQCWITFADHYFRHECDANEILSSRYTPRDARVAGWYADSYHDARIIGIVASLPHGRYLAGYRHTGTGARVYLADIYDTRLEAALMADEHARVAAEHELEADWSEDGGEQ